MRVIGVRCFFQAISSADRSCANLRSLMGRVVRIENPPTVIGFPHVS